MTAHLRNWTLSVETAGHDFSVAPPRSGRVGLRDPSYRLTLELKLDAEFVEDGE